jgi:membrane-associated protease RseP (regulator of RpoE activity)
MTFLIFVVTISVVVAVHEFGHYITARALHVPIESFNVGVGKELVTKRFGKTLWAFRLLPIGGYVKFYKSYSDELWWKRLLIAAAGPAISIIPVAAFIYSMSGSAIFDALGHAYIGGIMAFADAVIRPFVALGWMSALTSEYIVGPIGAATMVHNNLSMYTPWYVFKLMFILFSLGIGLLNLIPLPPFDGGAILTIFLERVFNEFTGQMVSFVLQMISYILVLWVFAVIMISDVIHLF